MNQFNFRGSQNILISICWILSYLSWILLSVNNFISLKWMYNPKMNENSQIWNIVIISSNITNLPDESTSSNSLEPFNTTIYSTNTYDIKPTDSTKIISDSINISDNIRTIDSIINLSDSIKSSEILGYSSDIKNQDKIKSSNILGYSNELKYSDNLRFSDTIIYSTDIKSLELINYSSDIEFPNNKRTSDTINNFDSLIISENVKNSITNNIIFPENIISSSSITYSTDIKFDDSTISSDSIKFSDNKMLTDTIANEIKFSDYTTPSDSITNEIKFSDNIIMTNSITNDIKFSDNIMLTDSITNDIKFSDYTIPSDSISNEIKFSDDKMISDSMKYSSDESFTDYKKISSSTKILDSMKYKEDIRFSDSIKKSDSDFIYHEDNNLDNSNSDYYNSDTIFPSETSQKHLRSLYVLSTEKPYIPMQMHYIMIYFIFNFAFSIIFIGCITFIIKTIFKKDQHILYGMMGPYTKFEFLPLLCAFILSILGEIKNSNNFKENTYSGLFITIMGLASMIFIYIMTNYNSNDWRVNFLLKKGTFSCLIILFWYNSSYVIYQIKYSEQKEHNINWQKGCSIVFSIIFGFCSLCFSFVFKNIMICFMNILIYIGMIMYYFDFPNDQRKEYTKNAEGAIDIIIMVCSMINFFYLTIQNIINEFTEIKSQMLTLGQVQTKTILKVNVNTEQINLLSNNINLTE